MRNLLRSRMQPRRMGWLGDNVGAPAQPLVSAPNRDVDQERYVEGRRFKFTYQTPNIASLAAAAGSTVIIQFDLDSVFCWLRTTIFADLAGAVQTTSSQVLPLCNLQITDTGSGQAMMNAPIPLPSIAGSGQLPYVEPTPQYIQPNTSLQFAFTNFSAATTYLNLRLQLQGFKIYGAAPAAQL